MIELFDGWVIVVDAYNYGLAKKRLSVNSKTGEIEERFDVTAYCASLISALKAFQRKLVRDELKKGTRTLNEALTVIKETEKKLEDFISTNLPNLERI